MKTIKFSLLIVSISMLASMSMAQDMQPPPPIENKTFEMSLGEWTAQPYTMMGNRITRDINMIYMKHNGQFMVIDVDASDSAGNNYTATVFISSDADGNLIGWAFDSWGMNGVLTYTGKTEGNIMTLTGANNFVSETRVITIDGDKMTHDIDFSLELPTGDVNEKFTVVYGRYE